MWFRDLISNQFLLTGISSWLWAQVLKTIIHALVTHRSISPGSVGDGGMAERPLRDRFLVRGGCGIRLRARLL